jgi:branched-chain amino acid transport system substrate-binding protein
MLRKLAFAAAIAGLAAPAGAQDAYVIGLTGALTGPPASTYAPAVEALRVYIERVNAAGGINGKKIALILQDDSAEPAKAAANAKKLIAQDNVILLINASLSSTYAPVVNEAKQAGVPLLFGSSVCPKDVYPPAADGQFCTTGFASTYDSRAVLAFVKGAAKEPVSIGFAAMAIPVSRGEIDFAEQQAPSFGMKVVGKEIIPPPTPDYTPFATKLKDANPNWVFSWAPWVTQVRTFEALRRLGWQGNYITWGHLESEGELARLKDGALYIITSNALFVENLPVNQEMREAAQKAGIKTPELMTEGWIAGMAIEAALKGTPWPPTPQKLLAAMQSLSVDTKGLRGAPLEWSKDNHFRKRQCYRVYRWDPPAGKIVRVADWTCYDVK